MHLKTNIEHSPVQLITLAMCPFLLMISSINDAIFMVSGTILCMFVSQVFIIIFNRYLNNDVKSLLTALISALIVTVLTIVIKEYTDKIVPNGAYVIVFSTTILNAEFIYFNNKAMTRHYFFNLLKVLIIFALMMLVYSVVKEFMAFGSIYGKQLFKFSGFEFCETIIFDLIWLATLCTISDFCVRYIDKKSELKNMVYQKYVRIIRTEKAFQYDKLRREKLLGNEIEVNRINKVDSEKIKQKEAENESIESVSEVISEEEIVSEEISEPKTKIDDNDSENESKNSNKSENGTKKRKKKEGKK